MGKINIQAAADKHDQDAVWNFIQEKIVATLDGQKEDCTFEELYRHVYMMFMMFKNGRLVYNGVRQIIKQHIDKMVTKLEDMANSHELESQVLLHIDEFWFKFTDQLQFICNGLIYLERMLPQEGPIELMADFGWRTFYTEILENQLIKQAIVNCLVFNPAQTFSSDENALDYKESPLFNVDTIIEIMTFLTTMKLGLQLSTASRQMAKLSNYVLNKRKPNLRPIVVFNGVEEETEPFSVQMVKENAQNSEGIKKKKINGNWFAFTAPECRHSLPNNEPPEWLTDVELIYIIDGLNNKTFDFLNALRDKLKNCQLIFNIRGFFAKLHEAGFTSQFFELFNERCFSLANEKIPWPGHTKKNNNIYKWPLWAIFNNIFFPNCRELTLTYDFLESGQMGLEVTKWLAHPSTENRPRLLKLCSMTTSLTENWFRWYGGFKTMFERIKLEFFTSNGKRKFFVEFPNRAKQNYGIQPGDWQNGIGEQLRIDLMGIARLPVDQLHKDFKDFYELPAVQPRIFLSAPK